MSGPMFQRIPKRAGVVLTALMLTSHLFQSCGKQYGCNSFGADNYDPYAMIDDGSCIEARDKFLGDYSVTSNCSTGAFERTISETADRFVVEISAINDSLGPVLGTVSAENIVISQQIVRNNVTVEGAGVFDLELNELNISLRIRDNRSGTTVITNCFENCRKH